MRRLAAAILALALAVLASAAAAQPPADPAPPAQPSEPAPAQPSQDFEDARTRMEKGQRLFADGKFAEALDEFNAAFERHKFSAFLFNAAVAAERAGKREQAVALYERFVFREPGAPDKDEIDKTIERLKKEQAAQEQQPSGETQRAAIKSLVLVESEPAGAPVTIFERTDPKAAPLDPRKPDQPGYRKVQSGIRTPANLSLALGTYFVLVEGFADYNPTGSLFTFEAGRAYVYRASLSQGDFVGRVEVTMPVSTAQIWVDDPPPHKNAPRAVGPSSIELAPGKHTFYIEAKGFEPFKKEIEVVQGKTVPLEADMVRVPYGYILVKGNAPLVEIDVNGKAAGVYKRRGDPLRIRVPAGEHFLEVDAEDKKAFEEIVKVPPGQEVTVDAKLEEAPGKGGAVVVTILSASFLAGAIVLNRVEANTPESDSFKDVAKGLWIGGFAGAGAFAALSVFLFVYDPTDDSTAKIAPPREFTGELPAEKEMKPEKKAGLPLEVGLLVAPAPLDPPAGFVAPLPAPAGLVVRGAF